MTVTDASTANEETPPPPPPASITFEGKYGKNPLADASFGAMCRRLPSVLGHTARMAWAVDRTGVVLLLVCQLLTGMAAAVVLAFTAQAMTHLLATGTVSGRLHAALPALVVVTTAAGIGRISGALSSYADGRITPLLMTEADVALVAAVCRVESAAYGEDGFADRQEAAEVGVTRTRMMVQDAQRFMSALVRMIAASGVITALHPLMLPLLLLAVLPAGAGAVLSARVDYETHYLNVGDRNVRSMMRWWATYLRQLRVADFAKSKPWRAVRSVHGMTHHSGKFGQLTVTDDGRVFLDEAAQLGTLADCGRPQALAHRSLPLTVSLRREPFAPYATPPRSSDFCRTPRPPAPGAWVTLRRASRESGRGEGQVFCRHMSPRTPSGSGCGATGRRC